MPRSDGATAAGGRIARFARAEGSLRCPVCSGRVSLAGTSLRCESGHAFDVSARGYANFLPHQRPLKGYDREFFRRRRAMMERGLYDHVVDAVLDAAGRALDGRAGQALAVDAGCGEGSYARALRGRLGCDVLAFDVSKDAAYVAAGGGADVLWAVADVARIPVADEAADLVLDAFTPANYREFSRILRPGGCIVKVVPGPFHMRELRHAARRAIRSESYSNERVVEHFAACADLVNRARATRTVELRDGEARDLAGMSPVLFGASERDVAAIELDRITVDAEVLVGRRR